MTLTVRHWSPHDTLAIQRITSLDVSPDGRRIAFTVMQAVTPSEQSSFQSQVYLASTDGSQPIRLIAGEFSSIAPQWSPNGQFIAFLSQQNVWLYALETGNVQQVTDALAGVSSFKWSPDGTMIAFTAPDDSEPTGEKDGPRIVGQGM